MTMTGHNSLNETTAKRWLSEVGRLYDELEGLKVEHMNACREVRERMKDVYELAKGDGVPVRALKSAIKVTRAEKALETLISKATPDDEDDAEAFEYLRSIASPGDLFDHATRHAAGRHAADDEDRDLRPRHLAEKDSRRGLPGADASDA